MFIRLFLKIINIDWLSFPPANCFPKHCFCEAFVRGFVRQPVNAYSNVIYIIIGIYIIYNIIRYSKQRRRVSEKTGLPRNIFYILALATFAVGVGSFIYHAGFTFFGEQLDDDSMYLVGSFLFMNNLSFIRRISPGKFLSFYILINLFLGVLIHIHPAVRGAAFGLLIISSLLIYRSQLKAKVRDVAEKNLLMGIKIFLIGFIVWILDYTRLFCYPNSIFQGHAVWHILTGISMLYIYRSMDADYIKEA